MAYAAVVSLVQVLDQLLQSDQFPDHHPRQQIQSLHENASSLQSSLEKIFPAPKSIRISANDLEIQIRNAVYEAQDSIEASISRVSETEETHGDQRRTSTSILLQKIIANIGPITKTAEEMANSLGCSKEDLQPGNSMSENAVSSKSSSTKSTKIVGQEEDLKRLTDQLTKEIHQLQVVPIIGTPGIGKTTLARSIYEDRRIGDHFESRAWVTVSSHNHVKDIFLKHLGSMEITDGNRDVSTSVEKLGNKVSQEGDEQLDIRLHKRLFNTPYLIVIDDMWDKKVWDKLKKPLPDNKNGSRILLTTRIQEIADYVKHGQYCHSMRPLDPENSWTLLCEKVFGGERCPDDHLEMIGRNIARSCGGLPLSITVVGGQLSQEKKTVDYWESVAKDINAAATTSDKPHLEILSLSYNHLPGRLKGCFLYMGAFPEDSAIPVSKLIKLWVAEGFLTPPSQPENLEQVAEQCLKHLIDRNLIFVRKTSSDGRIKTCGIHDSLRDLAINESQKEKFLHVINRHFLKLPEGADSQRRLSVHKNILMCMEDVYSSTKSIKLARTLLYVGPHHHHPLPFCLTFELLRVLDALTVYFIKFPIEIVKLIHLRYLSFTFNGKLPPSISKLRNLQTLIIRQYPKLIYTGLSILPVEIWSMPKLRHLLFTESDLPPIPCGAEIDAQNSVLLQNLQSLSNVNVACCTEEVLHNIPNLKKLGIWVEAPGIDVQFCLDKLEHIEALKFTVLNPIPGSRVNFLDELSFPRGLRKLSLSGCGIPWEDITVIGQLQCLEVLKLREFAFCGPEWVPEDDMEFPKLKYLLLESLDLENWEAVDSPFPSLERLIIRQCYELEGIPSAIGTIRGLQLIELVDCSSSAVDSARAIREQQKDLKMGLQVRIYSSRE